MYAINHQKQMVERGDMTNTLSGYSCPFAKEDCVHLDSLSMTKTVICDRCENFISGKITDISTDISFRILTNI